MKPPQTSSGTVAFTLIELLCVIAIITILAALLLPSISRGTRAAKRIQCVNQLHQMGLAFNAFAHDHNNRFPMRVPCAEGGSLEFAHNTYYVEGKSCFSFRHFQPLSNYLVITKPLVCPMDTRLPGQDFQSLKNENLSYFVNLCARAEWPNCVLAGDRNVLFGFKDYTLIRKAPGGIFRWDGTMHQYRGNLLFSDGHVDQDHSIQFAARRMPGSAASTDLVLPTKEASMAAPATSGELEPNTNQRQDTPSRYGAVPQRANSSRESIPASATSEATQPITKATATNSPPAIPVPVKTAQSPDVQHSPSAAFLAEVTEPLARERGLSLYLLLLLIICAALALRRWLQREQAPSIKVGATRRPYR